MKRGCPSIIAVAQTKVSHDHCWNRQSSASVVNEVCISLSGLALPGSPSAHPNPWGQDAAEAIAVPSPVMLHPAIKPNDAIPTNRKMRPIY
jgi:hypothetical protein